MNDYLDALAEAKGLTSLEYRLVAALRAVEALCDAGDEAAANATRAYPEGEPDPGPPPAWVWVADIRTAIRDALEAR